MNDIRDPITSQETPPATREHRKLSRIWRRRWLWLVVLALLAAGVYLFLQDRGAAQQAGSGRRGDAAGRVMPVKAAAAKTGDINVYINGLGTVTPLNTVTVRSRVDGQLMRVLFREGQIVKANDLLAEIDPRPFQVQLTQAEGQMARDKALLANARIDLERYRTLFAQDSIAKQQLDTQDSLVRQYEAAVKADQGQVDNARLQLVYSRVTAPISGRLGLRQVDPGNIVHATDQNGLVVITQLQPVTVVFPIPEDNVPTVMKRLQSGDTLPVEAYDRDGKVKLASGTLLTVDNQIDTTTGTVKLKAEFPNEDTALFPNQFVNVKMHVDTLRGATVMPTSAIQRGTQGTFVYVVGGAGGAGEEKSVAVRPLKLGPADGESVAVASGLQPGEMVVVDGGDKLRDGAKVQLVTRETGAAPSAKPQPSRGGEKSGERSGERSGEKSGEHKDRRQRKDGA